MWRKKDVEKRLKEHQSGVSCGVQIYADVAFVIQNMEEEYGSLIYRLIQISVAYLMCFLIPYIWITAG